MKNVGGLGDSPISPIRGTQQQRIRDIEAQMAKLRDELIASRNRASPEYKARRADYQRLRQELSSEVAAASIHARIAVSNRTRVLDPTMGTQSNAVELHAPKKHPVEATKLRTSAPMFGETILEWLYPSDRCEALLGDMQERFLLIAERDGRAWACAWYYFEVARSIGALLIRLLQRAALIKELIDKLGL